MHGDCYSYPNSRPCVLIEESRTVVTRILLPSGSSGGFGAVFGTVRGSDGARVAIKVMLPRLAVEKAAVEKFLREMKVTAKLQHSNTVRLLNMGQESGIFYFVMEYCDGGSV